MAIEGQFKKLMPNTVNVYARTGYDDYANPTWSSSASAYSCHIRQGGKVIHDRKENFGIDVPIRGVIYIYGAPATITTEDKLTLPDGTQVRVLLIDYVHDNIGHHHTAIFYGDILGKNTI